MPVVAVRVLIALVAGGYRDRTVDRLGIARASATARDLVVTDPGRGDVLGVAREEARPQHAVSGGDREYDPGVHGRSDSCVQRGVHASAEAHVDDHRLVRVCLLADDDLIDRGDGIVARPGALVVQHPEAVDRRARSDAHHAAVAIARRRYAGGMRSVSPPVLAGVARLGGDEVLDLGHVEVGVIAVHARVEAEQPGHRLTTRQLGGLPARVQVRLDLFDMP